MRRLGQWRFGRYVLVGVVCALLDTAVVWLLDRQGASATVSLSLGYAVALLLNYLLHARFTFSIDQLGAGQFARFVAVIGLNYLLTLAVVGVLHRYAALDVVVAKVVSLLPVALNGYYLSKVWVFRRGR